MLRTLEGAHGQAGATAMSGFKPLVDDFWRHHLAAVGIDEGDIERQHLAMNRNGDLLFRTHSYDGRAGVNLLGEPDDYVTTRLRQPKGSMKYKSPPGREVEPYLPVLDPKAWQHRSWIALRDDTAV